MSCKIENSILHRDSITMASHIFALKKISKTINIQTFFAYSENWFYSEFENKNIQSSFYITNYERTWGYGHNKYFWIPSQCSLVGVTDIQLFKRLRDISLLFSISALLLLLGRLVVRLEKSTNGEIVDDLFHLLHVVLQRVELLPQTIIFQVQKTESGLKI